MKLGAVVVRDARSRNLSITSVLEEVSCGYGLFCAVLVITRTIVSGKEVYKEAGVLINLI